MASMVLACARRWEAFMNGVRSLLTDKTCKTDVQEMDTAVCTEFGVRGYKMRPEDLKSVFEMASVQAKPIGNRLEREFFGKRSRAES